MEDIIQRFIVELRLGFTLRSNREFIVACIPVAKKLRMLEEQLWDSITEAAQSKQYDKEFQMAKVAKETPAPVVAKAAPKAAPKAKAKAKATAPVEVKERAARAPKYEDTAKITWNVPSRPGRDGTASHERATSYWKSKTVAAFLEAGGTRGDLAHHVASEWVSVE